MEAALTTGSVLYSAAVYTKVFIFYELPSARGWRGSQYGKNDVSPLVFCYALKSLVNTLTHAPQLLSEHASHVRWPWPGSC
jgi:hypothetical protein